MPPDRLVTQVRSDTLKKMYVTRGLGKKYGPTPGCPGCAAIGSQSSPSQSLGRMQNRMRAELEKSEEGREYLAREQAEDLPRTPKVNRPGNEPQMNKQKIWRITSRWMQMKVQRHPHKRRGVFRWKKCPCPAF